MTKKNSGVGYGNPPTHTQFKPGQSGNPAGRPNGAKNLKTDLSEELAETIPAKENGKTKNITKQRAMVKSLTAKAIKGDPRAISILVNLLIRLMEDRGQEISADDLSQADQEILDRFLNNTRSNAKSNRRNGDG